MDCNVGFLGTEHNVMQLHIHNLGLEYAIFHMMYIFQNLLYTTSNLGFIFVVHDNGLRCIVSKKILMFQGCFRRSLGINNGFRQGSLIVGWE